MADIVERDILIKRLKDSDIDAELLKSSAEITAKLSKYGLKDWCVFGQPGPDGTCSKFHLPPGEVGDFIKEIADLKSPWIDLDVFPLGIIGPDSFEINVRFGVRRLGR